MRAALAARPGAVRGRLVAARRLPRPGDTLERSIRAQLARKVDVAELSWLEQLETLSEPDRHPGEWQLATAYLGLVPRGLDPALPEDTAWHPVDACPSWPSTTSRIVLAGRERLRAKLSYTNIGFALAPESVLDLRAVGDLHGRARLRRSTPPTCAACSSAAACSRPPASAARPGAAAGGPRRSTASARASWR